MDRSTELFFELLKEFYEKAFQDGVNYSQISSPEGSFSYRNGYKNGRRDVLMECLNNGKISWD